MAYAALISVLKTLVELQNPFPFQVIEYPGSQVRDLQENLIFLKDFLETISPKARYLEDRIRVAMYDAEDALDSNLLNFIPNSESSGWAEDNYMRNFSRSLEKVNNTVGSIAKEAKEISPHVKRPPLLLMPPTPEVSRRNQIVGREDDLTNLKSRLTGGSDKLAAVPIFGIRGIGKTRLAQTVYDDPEIVNMFRFRAWVKVPQDYSKKDILLGLLRSMSKLDSGKEDDLAERLFYYLRQGKYLIVLDEVCDPMAWDNLKELFPDYYIGSRVMLTTRLKEVAENEGDFMEILPLDGEESWALLQSEVFRYKACPEELVPTAKRVSTNCKGIPLAIVTIGGVLMEAGPKDWAIAASSLNDCGDCDELIDTVMSLSYKSLRQYARACLLYMGIFPDNYDIPLSKLLKLWIAEGFIESNEQFNSPEKMGEGCLSMLVERGFVVVSKQSPLGNIKTCRVDGVYYEFLKKKANEEKFFHVVNDYTSSFPNETCTHGRFSIRENIQFVDEDELKLKKPVRSLLFNGAKEQYPLWVHFNFKLLRVLDAVQIQFYGFPDEILKLIHLRYLALTYSGEIPDKICGLWNLQFLIILRHVSSKTFEVVSRLPLEIWNMSELRHLQLMGRNLPDPSTTTLQLENLVTLLDVSSHSCTPEIFERVPNLKILGVRIESPALDGAEDFSFLSHLANLENLESFKCVVMYPDFASQVASHIPTFPATLTKLSLSGCGLSWDNMKVIATLPKLESLKLRWHAFRGAEWKQEGDGNDFPQLKFLLLEDLGIQWWKAGTRHFPRLTNLVIRHCYKLREIPAVIGNITTLKTIELVDCNASAQKSAQEIKVARLISRGYVQVDLHSSRDD